MVVANLRDVASNANDFHEINPTHFFTLQIHHWVFSNRIFSIVPSHHKRLGPYDWKDQISHPQALHFLAQSMPRKYSRVS
jgi:hypothetical protein